MILWGTTVCGFLATTATPGQAGWQEGRNNGRFAEFQVSLVPWGELLRFSEVSLNVWLGVPLGLVALVAAFGQRVWWPVAVALALPIVGEGVQWLLPQLGRSAFFLSDALANLQGVLAGFLISAPILFGIWARRRRSVSAGVGSNQV